MSEILQEMRRHLLPLYVLGVDINKIQEPVSRPDGYPSCQISLCLEGSGIYVDENGEEHLIEKGNLFFFSGGTPHEYKAVSEKWKLPYIVFTGRYAREILDYLEFGRSMVITNLSTDSFYRISTGFRKIYETYFSSLDSKTERVSAMLYALLVDISEARNVHTGVGDNTAVQQLAPVMNYINRSLDRDMSVDELASVIGVSAGRLGVLFKQAFGTTPVHAIRKYRLECAKRILCTHPNIKMKELAEMTGFSSTSYFVTMFKKEFGMSPTDYKNTSVPDDFIWW